LFDKPFGKSCGAFNCNEICLVQADSTVLVNASVTKSQADYRALFFRINQRHPCRNGYQYSLLGKDGAIARGRPGGIHGLPLDFWSSQTEMLEHCSDQALIRPDRLLATGKRCATWYKLRAVQAVLDATPSCKVAVWLDSDAVLLDDVPLHRQRQLQRWMESSRSHIFFPREPPGLTFKRESPN